MRRILLILALVAGIVTSGLAQNANRKGFFIEAQGGVAFGEVLVVKPSYSSDGDKEVCSLKGGGTATIDFGFRIPTSRHLAFEIKLGGYANLAEAEHTNQIRLLPGLRWTSNDFGSMSAYLSLNTGFGLSICGDMPGFVPVEFNVGLNVTRKFYVGLSYTENILCASGVEVDWIYTSSLNYNEFTNTYGCMQFKVGYRF